MVFIIANLLGIAITIVNAVSFIAIPFNQTDIKRVVLSRKDDSTFLDDSINRFFLHDNLLIHTSNNSSGFFGI